MGDLRPFEARGIFDHLNCQHTREFDQKFSKKSNALGFSRGGGTWTLLELMVQWNPVNKDTKGTCHSVRTIRVSVLSGLSEKTSITHVLSILRPKQTVLRTKDR